MDTRPKHVQLTVPKAFIEGQGNPRLSTPCSRERFFRQARKPDDGDRPRGFGGPKGPPPASDHRRGGLTPHGGKRSAGRPESFMNYSG
jgi:hypothetical protein